MQTGARAIGAATFATLGLAVLVACGDDTAPAPTGESGGPSIAVVRLTDGGGVDVVGHRATRTLLSAEVWPIAEQFRRLPILSWSPDGRRLAYTGRAATATTAEATDLWLLDYPVGTPRPLTATGDAGAPAFAPNGRTIAFARGKQGARAVWLIDAGGGGQRPFLATSSGPRTSDVPGAWSPDGERLAFTRFAPERITSAGLVIRESHVYIAGADGRQLRRLASGYSPVWSPDGRRIAFISERDRHGQECYGDLCRTAGEVYVADVDSGRLRRLTRTRTNEDNPSWSPGGRRLAVQRGEGYDNAEAFSVWTMNDDGSCLRPLARDPSRRTWFAAPAWRPSTDAEWPPAC